jgi:hypothetical protein
MKPGKYGFFKRWVSKMFAAKGHIRYCELARGLRGEKMTVIGLSNCLSYGVIFIVYTLFTKEVAVGRIQRGWPRVGNPRFKPITGGGGGYHPLSRKCVFWKNPEQQTVSETTVMFTVNLHHQGHSA